VILMGAAPSPLDYAVPAGWNAPPGTWVVAPLGPRKLVGLVWEADSWPGRTVPDSRLRPLAEVLAVPPVPATTRRFLEWVAHYYLAPPGTVLRMTAPVSGIFEPERFDRQLRRSPHPPTDLSPRRRAAWEALGAWQGSAADLTRATGVSPAMLRALTGAGAVIEEAVTRDAPFPCPEPDHAPPALSADQADAVARLRALLAGQPPLPPVLLEGVTGSGKTEVYSEAIADVLRGDGQVLVLLPEIALTSQWLKRFTTRFGCAPVAWHSDLNAPQRRRAWKAIATGQARVVVGARSALFLPYPALRLIVVDEEHETSFKQDDGVGYHARDAAVMRARLEGCGLVLASATPSLESVYNADQGRYAHIGLPARFGGASLPRVTAIDLRRQPPPAGHWLSAPLVDAVSQTIAAGEQALLFLNRRGYAPVTLCRTCGTRITCPQCAAWLVEHRLTRRLHCHHCAFAMPVPRACPSCGSTDSLVACGPGVERVAEEAQRVLPQARTVVVTSDTLYTPARVEAFIAEVESGAVDLIIGTQLVAKGHHFPKLTLVGVVDADLGLGGGDLRAAERTFQQITQVAGRAGRAERPGRVLLQTHAPEQPVMQALIAADTARFRAAELAARARHQMPPYGRLAALILSGGDPDEVGAVAQALARCAPQGAGIAVLGPAPAPLALLRGRHRMRLLLKADRGTNVPGLLRDWLARGPQPRGVHIAVDVDPQSFL